MLYEAISGRPPFYAKSATDTPRTIVMQHVTTPLPPASSFVPEISPATDQVFVRALAKRPDERYVSAVALCTALVDAANVPFAANDNQLVGSTAALVDAATPANAAYVPRRQVRTRSRRRLILIAATIIAVLAVAGGLLLNRQPGTLSSGFPDPTPQPAPPASKDWYFANSWVGTGYRTVISVYNPQAQSASLTLTFVGLDGTQNERTGTVAARQRAEFEVVALFANDYTTRIRGQHIHSDVPVEVTHLIANAGHGAPISGATTEATSWTFLENRSPNQGDKWLEIANFREQEAVVRVSYRVASGRSETKTYSVTPHTVVIIGLNQDFPQGIGRWQINVENGVPVVTEMTAYESNGDILANMIGEAIK